MLSRPNGLFLLRFQSIVNKKGFIRAVNYHSVPNYMSMAFEKQLRFYEKYYTPVSLRDLQSILTTGSWHKSKPGIIITFDDGLQNQYAVAAPLLDKYGFIGWFFIPSDVCDLENGNQRTYALKHRIKLLDSCKNRIFLNWREVRELASKHVVGSHTRSHLRLSKDVSAERIKKEITQSKQIIEENIDNFVETFAWVGGESETYNYSAMPIIAQAGYKFVFTTISSVLTPRSHPLMLGRTNIESSWPQEIVYFQLSGMVDLLYLKKRHFIHKLLKPELAV